MARIGIYGGSFNPVHLGHTSLAEAICQAGGVDEVWLMVSPLNPLKQQEQHDILPTPLRLLLAEKAVVGSSCLNVSDFETRLPIPSYSVVTLEELVKAFPQHTFLLIMGQDNWTNFHRWVRADDIRSRHDIIVYGRSDSHDPAQSKADVRIIRRDGTEEVLSNSHDFRLFDISSTEIRRAFQLHDLPFAAKWLHPEVFRYILENGLYRD